MQEIVNRLIKNNETISTMESCTGGYIANLITNIKDSSKILKFSAITYSNEYKIKMGVDEEIINKYTVYSMETANEMSKKITIFTNSDYGIGVTGKLNKQDDKNPYGENNIVYISIYNKKENKYYNKQIEVTCNSREENKKTVAKETINLLTEIIK